MTEQEDQRRLEEMAADRGELEGVNKARAMVIEKMRERGIDRVEELARRMKEFAEHKPRRVSVAKVTTFVEEDDPALYPEFFQALTAALGLSKEEHERLLWAHFAGDEPLPPLSSSHPGANR